MNVKLYDNVWGNFEIVPKIYKIFRHIQGLKDKTQLGLMRRHPYFTGANHTRYDHSVGTLYVASKFIKACKKFDNYFPISENDEMAFLLSALLHDAGHGPYSHSFEDVSKISHEDETIKKINGLRNEIDLEFGVGTCDKIIMIIENGYKIKTDDSYEINPKLNLIFVLSELMSGAIDVDRIDYIARDYLNIYGKFTDFTKIFDYMELELVNDQPKIVFREECVPMLEDFFLTRYRAYNDIYLEDFSVILDHYFVWFIKEAYANTKISSDLTENTIDGLIDNKNHENFKQQVSSDVLSGRNLSSVLYKSFNSKEDREIFISRLSRIVNLDDYFFESITRKVVIYDSKKNNVLIKSGDKVRDFLDVSQIIRDKIFKKKYLVLIDLKLLQDYLLKSNVFSGDIGNKLNLVKNLFVNPVYEIEKKFLLKENILPSLNDMITEMTTLAVSYNTDNCYSMNPRERDVTIRKREGKSSPYTLKVKSTDSTSVSKREEYNFPEMSEESFISIVKEILLQRNYNPKTIERDLLIETERKKGIVKINESYIEVAIDKSKYSKDSNFKYDYMLELELKSGNTIDLWYLSEKLKRSCDLEECNVSKYSRALELLELN